MDEIASRGFQIILLTTKPDDSLEVMPSNFPYPTICHLRGKKRELIK